MNNATPRPIFVSVLIGTLSVCSLSLLWDNRTLSRQNQHAYLVSQRLQQAFDRVASEHRALAADSEGRNKEKQALKEAAEALKKQNETLSFQLKKLESQIGSVKEEKNYLEEMLINKTKQIEILKDQEGEGTYQSPSGPAVRAEIGEREEELRKLNEQNRVLQEKLDRLFKTTNEKMNEINVAKIALAETVSTAQRKIEDEWNTVNLGSVTTSAMPARQNEVEETPAPHEPKTEGHVLAINSEHGFVVIDLGRADNLPSDALLEVRKNGMAIATLSVLETRDVMAACNIKEVQDGQRIEINDPVSILR